MTVSEAAGGGAPRSALMRGLDWWAGELASGLRGMTTPKDPWRVVLMHGPDGHEAYARSGGAAQRLGSLPRDPARAPERALLAKLQRQAVRPEAVVLRLARDEVVHTRVSLPKAVEEVLGQILRNQLERHAPWPASQALYAFEVAGTSADGARIDVDLWVAGKSRVEEQLAALAAHGLKVGTVDFGDTPEPAPTLNLVGHAAESRRDDARRVLKVLAAAGLLALAASLASLGYAWYEAGRLEAAEARLAALKKAASTASAGEGDAARRRAAVLALKRDLPSMAVLIEALSRAVPDDAWLERLEVREGTLTIAGKATRAASLVAPLEASKHLADVQFSAPTTRQEGDQHDTFAISARILPNNALSQ